MFHHEEILEIVDEVASLPYAVTLLSPFAFDIRPKGFAPDTPGYRVSVSRSAFRIKAEVITDPMAVALRSAIVAGAANMPDRVDALRQNIVGLGWSADVSLSGDEFRIAATDLDAPHRPQGDQVHQAVMAAVTLSEYVLNQLVVTRAGEMRPAVERSPAEAMDDHDPWMYDPGDRDRATARHRALENWLIATLRDSGMEPLDPASEPFFDIAWRQGSQLVVCEVKTTSGSEDKQMRLGIGQVLHYREQLARTAREPVRAALLVERQPSDQLWPDLCHRLGIVLFWPSNWSKVSESIDADTANDTDAVGNRRR